VLPLSEAVTITNAVSGLLERWRAENRRVWGTITGGEDGIYVYVSGMTDDDEQRVRSIVPAEALTIEPCMHSWANEQRYRIKFPRP
jgi:hypothetical protein